MISTNWNWDTISQRRAIRPSIFMRFILFFIPWTKVLAPKSVLWFKMKNRDGYPNYRYKRFYGQVYFLEPSPCL